MNHGRTKTFIRLAKWLLALAVALCIAGAMRRYSVDLRAQLGRLRIDPVWFAAAVAVAIFYRVFNSCGWVFVLRALRCALPVLQGARVWLVSETMRWLPGCVWGYVSRVYAARQAGVETVRASLSVSLELVLTVAAWSLTAAASLLLSGMAGRLFKLVKLPALPPGWLLICGALLLVTGIWIFLKVDLSMRIPKKVRDILADLHALVRRPPRLDYSSFTLVFYVALCVLNGINFWLILRALSPAPVPLAAVIAINAIGWLAGFFAFMAPGGLGVREAGIAGMLALFVPLPVAVTAALLWRALQVVIELLCLSVCMLPVAQTKEISDDMPGYTL